MTTEELLRPRFKVIADYPESEHNNGDILFAGGDPYIAKSINYFKSYPAIFKKLEWWEERKESDMPEYIKFKYSFSPVIQIKPYCDNYTLLAGTKMIDNYLPATKEEYETQNKK